MMMLIFLCKRKILASSMDLLLIVDDDKSHYVYVKNFNRFLLNKTKNKNKKDFCKSCLQCFGSENVLTGCKKDCLGINGTQSVKLEKGTIECTKYFKKYQFHLKFMLILSLI